MRRRLRALQRLRPTIPAKATMTPDVELTQMTRWLRGLDNPLAKGTLRVRETFSIAAPDYRGLVEVNYLTPDQEPMTAWLRDRSLAYVDEGW